MHSKRGAIIDRSSPDGVEILLAVLGFLLLGIVGLFYNFIRGGVLGIILFVLSVAFGLAHLARFGETGGSEIERVLAQTLKRVFGRPWPCLRCGSESRPLEERCGACGERNPELQWTCPLCKASNLPDLPLCMQCSSPRFEEPD